MHRMSFRTLYGASRMQQGFYVFISEAGGYLQKGNMQRRNLDSAVAMNTIRILEFKLSPYSKCCV
jgi:hypothetical protein